MANYPSYAHTYVRTDSIEIQRHKRLNFKPKAAIIYTEISSLIYKTDLIFNEHQFFSTIHFTEGQLSIVSLPVIRSSTVESIG